MTTPSTLFHQRVRWYRGALDNLKLYGITKVTLRYWFQQLALLWGMLMVVLLTVLTVVAIYTQSIQLTTFTVVITAIFSTTSTITVLHSRLPDGTPDTKSILLAPLLLPELVYNYILFSALATALFQHLTNSTPQWKHIERNH